MEKHDTLLQIHLERPIYEQETLNEDYHYEKPKTFGMYQILDFIIINVNIIYRMKFVYRFS